MAPPLILTREQADTAVDLFVATCKETKLPA